MKNRSLRSSIIILTSLAIIISTIAIMLVAIVGIHVISERSATQVMQLLDKENAANMNNSINEIEQAVDTMAAFAQDSDFGLGSDLNRLFVDSDYRSEYLEKVRQLAKAEMELTKNASTVYCQLSIEITGSSTNFLYVRDAESGQLMEGLPVEVTNFESSDLEHVGWYFEPKNNKGPVWIGPYKNKNYGMEVISYVVPLYAENVFIGVIGMDINVTDMAESMQDIEGYEGGAILLFGPSGELIYHSAYKNGKVDETSSLEQEKIGNEAMKKSLDTGSVVEYRDERGIEELYAETMANGMIVTVIVPQTAIYAMQQRVIWLGALIGASLLIISILITTFLINRFLKPLNELITASEQLADGNVDVTINYKENDEIGRLGQTFELMANSIKKYFDHFHSLAYTDSLTGLNNKAAYGITRDVIESEVQMGRASFSIIVMDVNNLKVINDTLGHEKGDILLTHVTECLRKTFVGFPLYRIGGDEFCSIINETTDPEMLITLLQTVTAKKSEDDFEFFQCRYQIAAGAATYEKEKDISFDDVFQRADDAMYENKKMLKERDKQEKVGVGVGNVPDVSKA